MSWQVRNWNQFMIVFTVFREFFSISFSTAEVRAARLSRNLCDSGNVQHDSLVYDDDFQGDSLFAFKSSSLPQSSCSFDITSQGHTKDPKTRKALHQQTTELYLQQCIRRGGRTVRLRNYCPPGSSFSSLKRCPTSLGNVDHYVM